MKSRSRGGSRIGPGLVLFLLAPFIGEFLPGSNSVLDFVLQPAASVFVYFIFAALYGCGAIVVRELVCKWNKGWISTILLGLGYAILEEGIVVQSFSNPAWGGLSVPATYGRLWGINWPWVENIMIFHALISISLSIVVVALLFPGHRRERYTSDRTLLLCFSGLIFSVVVGGVLYPYWSGFLYYSCAFAAIAVLGYFAKKAPRTIAPKRVVELPSWAFTVFGFVMAFVFYDVQYALPSVVSAPILMITTALLAVSGFAFLFYSRSRDGVVWMQFSLVLGVVLYFVVWVSSFRPVSAPNSIIELVLIIYLGLKIRGTRPEAEAVQRATA
jgi:hypothetical protein